MNTFQYRYIPFVILFLFSACAKQNAGIVKQTYHDLTGHYNGYFNANEIYNQQVKSSIAARNENYEQILPLYPIGNVTAGEGGDYTTAIAKARLSIQTHQEKQESKNYQKNEDNSISNWADDAFLLMGKCYYNEGQIDSAISCFKYITAHFDIAVDGRSKEKIKKQKSNKKLKAKAKKLEDKQIELEKKGKDVRPSKKLFLHESAKSEALVWLVKAYTANKQYGEAESVLTYIKNDKTFLKNYDKEVALAAANLLLSQQNYSSATNDLLAAAELSKKKKEKARIHFILAQIYEQQNQADLAASYYKKSIKGNPNFEMVFYAKFKSIQMKVKGSNPGKDVDRMIAKLIKDKKNEPYLDILYYERGLLALQMNEREDAKEYLALSAKNAKTNQKQKGNAFVKLAELFYEEENYPIAQAYYDSAVNSIDETFESYVFIKNRSETLTDLITNLETITVNDSLLNLSKMDAKQLESHLYKLAVDFVDAEIKNEEKAKQSIAIASSSSGKGSKNAWYFYSESSRNSGYKKFQQIWGDIALEDNWRRSDKSTSEDGEDNESSDEEDEYFSRIEQKYDEMLAAVPASDAEKKALKEEIIEAYFNAGVLYKSGLENYPKSLEMFTALNAKYDKHAYRPDALYHLYVIHSEEKNSTAANQAKNELLSDYPNHKYSKFLKDPSSLDSSAENDLAKRYETIYKEYENGNYDEVIKQCENVKENFKNHPLLAKYDLLKAMAIGGKQLREPFIASLENVVNDYQNTEEQAKAQELLYYLKGEDEKAVQEEATKEKLNTIKEDNTKINQESIKSSDEESEDGVKLKFGEKEINLGGTKKGK